MEVMLPEAEQFPKSENPILLESDWNGLEDVR
jgi:hypothetical protein